MHDTVRESMEKFLKCFDYCVHSSSEINGNRGTATGIGNFPGHLNGAATGAKKGHRQK